MFAHIKMQVETLRMTESRCGTRSNHAIAHKFS